MKFLIFIPFLILSCTAKTEKKEPEVLVQLESQVLPGAEKTEAVYSFTEDDCKVVWQTIVTGKGQTLDVHLRNRTDCKWPFAKAEKLHEKVIARLLKDYPAEAIKSLGTGGLQSLQPDGSWNSVIAKAAEQSADYQDFRKNYPNHKSKKSSNGLLTELIQQTQAHAPFKDMLAKHSLNFELVGVEKVFQTKNEQGVTLIDDAGSFWWKPVQK